MGTQGPILANMGTQGTIHGNVCTHGPILANMGIHGPILANMGAQGPMLANMGTHSLFQAPREMREEECEGTKTRGEWGREREGKKRSL